MWQIMLCVGVISLILEIFMPTAFFLNFSIAGFVCAILAFFVHSFNVVIVTFCVLSLLLLLVLRPIILGFQKSMNQKTGMNEKYVGKTAVVTEDIDKTKGLISIYDERWQARNIEDGVIPAGSTIEIVGYDSIIMKVKKNIDKKRGERKYDIFLNFARCISDSVCCKGCNYCSTSGSCYN